MRDFTLTLVALLILTALTLVPARLRPPQPAAQPVVTALPPSVARIEGSGFARSMDASEPALPAKGSIAEPLIGGRATWYPASGMIAAAGPALRHYLGKHWRGMLVSVCGSGRCVVVRASDWCLCTGNGGRLIDLSDDAFAQLAPLSRGVLRVSITRAVRVPAPPATDTAP